MCICTNFAELFPIITDLSLATETHVMPNAQTFFWIHLAKTLTSNPRMEKCTPNCHGKHDMCFHCLPYSYTSIRVVRDHQQRVLRLEAGVNRYRSSVK